MGKERLVAFTDAVIAYEQAICLQAGLLTRDMVWTSPKDETFTLKFERIVSLKCLHAIAMRVFCYPGGRYRDYLPIRHRRAGDL